MAGNRQQFTLQFNADTAQAKRAIQDLNNSLKKVSEASINDFGISRELEEASNAAKELRTHIAAATNASTGKLNLNEFNASIKMSESNLSSLLSKLASGGAAGQAAFMSFANAVAQSEAPLKRVNATLANMATTLKNTLKWELSSTVIHGLESALSGAVSYVKDLNTSLTNIRIVTGQSANDMAKFALEANRAAKELSTTTKSYADASLIYYQQGDSAEQAAKKAAITIKAANSSFNTSAAEMSEYLTAVWNSYRVGANELERYVDIMAALGAKTATSLEEIATSMQKVAATANTVGVSMEQVSSIISTVSSVTRESAESIGTSYKTIFARIGDLKLGETLDDGVTLGSVSKQLQAIGVSILDANGNMREMGDIITDLGNRWQTMSQAQKTATAQVVAGKRQYTQLMALFENWDMYNQNMNIATNADGALQEMADVYAESWEAASARVKASMESLYSSLINDKAIIQFTNFISKIVDGISSFVSTLGGAGGVLKTFGAIGLMVFQKQISNGITSAIQSIQKFFSTKGQVSEYVSNLSRIKSTLMSLKTTSDQAGVTTEIDNSIKLLELKENLASKEKDLTDTQQAAAQAMISSMSEEINMVNQLGKSYDSVDQKIQQMIASMAQADLREMDLFKNNKPGQTIFQADKQGYKELTGAFFSNTNLTQTNSQAMSQLLKTLGANTISELTNKYASAVQDTSAIDAAIERIQSIKTSGEAAEAQAKELGLAFEFIEQYAQKATPETMELFNQLKTNMTTMPVDELTKKMNDLKAAIILDTYGVSSYEQLRQKLTSLGLIVPANASKFDMLEMAAKEAGLSFYQLDMKTRTLESSFLSLQNKTNSLGTNLNKNLGTIQMVASALMSLSASFSASFNAAKNWDDGGIAEKIGSVLSGLTNIFSLTIEGAAIGSKILPGKGALIGAAISLVTGLVSSIFGAFSGSKEKEAEEATEKLAEMARESKQYLNDLATQKNTITSLATSYGELRNQMDIDYVGYTDSVLALTEELLKQDTTVQGLITRYGSLEQAVIGARKQHLIETRDKGTKAISDQVATIEGENFYTTQIDGTTFVRDATSALSTDQQLAYDNLIQEAATRYFKDNNQQNGVSAQYAALTAYNAEYDPTRSGWDGDDNLFAQLMYSQENFGETVDAERAREWFNQEFSTLLGNALTTTQNMLKENIITEDQFFDTYGQQILQESLNKGGQFDFTDPDNHFIQEKIGLYVTDLATQMGVNHGWTPGAVATVFDDWKRNEDWYIDDGENYLLNPERYANSQYQGYFTGWTEEDPVQRLLTLVNTKIVGSLGNQHIVTTANEQTMPEDLNLLSRAVQENILTADEALRLSTDGLSIMEKYGIVSEDMAKFITNFGNKETAEGESLKNLATSEGAQIVSDAELELSVIDEYALKGYNLNKNSSTDYFNYINNMAQDLVKQGVPAFEAIDKALSFAAEWGINSQFTDDYNALTDIAETIAETSDANPFEILGKVIDTYLSYGENFKYLNFYGATYKDGEIQFQGKQDKMIAFSNAQSKLTTAQTQEATIKELAAMSPDELLAMSATDFERYTNDINWLQVIPGFEGVTSIETWAQLNTTKRQEYLDAILKNTQDSIYGESGYLQTSINAAETWASSLEELYHTQMGHEKNQDGSYKRNQDGSYVVGDAETLYTKAIAENNKIRSAMEIFDGTVDLSFVENWYDLQEDEIEQLNAYGSVLTAAGIDLQGQTAAEYIAGFKTNSQSAARTWYNENRDDYVNNQTYIDYIDSIPGQVTSINTQGQALTNQKKTYDTFGNMPEDEKDDKLTDAEKKLMQMERAQKKINELTSAISEFQSKGKLSKTTKSALEMLGIDADNIDTIEELTDQIKTLQKDIDLTDWTDVATASGLRTDQLTGEKGIFQTDGTVKGFDELEDSTITQKQYNNAVRAYEMKLAILNIDTAELELQYQQAEATKKVNEAIELQKQTVEKLKEDAAEMTAAYEALSNSIGESALSFETITKATQAGLDVSGWSSDITKQLDIISQAAYKAYEAEKAVLEAQKNNFDTSKMKVKQDDLTDEARKILSKSTLDSGEVDKFINDYFSQFNGATQEAVRTYLSNIKAAGKSFSLFGEDGLVEELKAANLMTDDEIALLKANLKDGLTGMLDKAITEHQEAAQKVADAWITAFDAIMKAKEGLADGKSIAESLMGDQEGQTALLAKYLTNNPNASKQDAMNWLHNQNLSQTSAELTPEKWSSKDWSNARGMFSVANRYGDDNYATTQGQWEQWVKDRFTKEWNKMSDEAKKEITDKGGTFDSYLEDKWAEFLDGRTKEQAYNAELAAMIVAESDANQQFIESQIQTAQTVYQNTVENAQTQQSAWQKVYDAQQQVLSDTTGELTLSEALGENLNTVLAEINKGRDENNQLTIKDLETMSLNQIASEINTQSATINAAQVTLQESLTNTDVNGDGEISGTPIKDSSGNIVDASNNKTAQEAVEAAQENTNTAKDAEITTGIGGQAFADTWDSVALSVGMAKDEFKELAQYLYETAGHSGNLDAASEDLQDTYRRLAKEVTEIQNAWDDLTKSQADNIKMIKNQEKANAKYPSGLKKLTKDIKKIFSDSEKVTEDFVEEHIDLIEKMVEGDLDAAEELEGELLKDILGDDKFNEPIKVDFDVDHDGIVDQLSTVGELLNNFGDEFADKPIGFTVDVDDSAALASLSNMATNGTLSAEQIQAAFDAIGWAPEVEVDDYTLTEEDIGRGYINVPSVDPITGKVSYEQHSIDSSYQAGQTIAIPRIGKATKKPGGASSNPYKNNGGNKGGGGGGGKPKKIDKKKPEDEKERYHETEQTLDRLADELDKVDKLKSRAYGKGHLDAIKQEIDLLKQEVGVQADYLRQAKEYLTIDRNRVASLGATFNTDGTISNYDELMDSIIAKYNAFVDKYNSASAKQQEDMEEEKEKMDEWYEESIEWISQYEETLNLTRDKENEIIELQNEISAKTLEGIQYKVEIEVELNDAETEFLDYLNEKYSETLEKQGLLVENLVREQRLAQENLAALNTAKTELDAKYASGELTQADYVEGLKDINGQILDNLSTLEELRKEIQEAYGNALDLATEKIDNHTEKMENASSAMQSYISIMGLLGQGIDYEKINEFYEQQYEYNLASLETQQQYLDALKEEEAYYLAKMASGELTETEREQFEALQDTIASVQDGILSKTEETLSALKEAFSSMISGILRDFEESIAGAGNSLEDLAADYEYYLEVQERNVSTSKELYEVSKLNRQIEQDIADTSSSVYKQRLAALQEEIKAKSADRALTEYDIQMMNLEYELLQRQMALEEAKSAKDTVRLTRDSSGNYVYQYTANQDAVNEAQQGVEDVLQRMAEANAERVGQLEQETINAYQDMVAQIEEIANSEVLTQEEKNAKIAEIVARTQEKMGWIQDQYTIATENTALTYERIQDQYGKNMADAAQMTKDSMNGTIGEIINKTNEFSLNMQSVQGAVAEQLKLLQGNMDAVLTTTKWNEAAESIKDYDVVIEDAQKDAHNMIMTLGGENGLLTNIRTTTAAWDLQSKAIENLITYYEQLYKSILKIQQTESTKTPAAPDIPTPSTPPANDDPETDIPADDAPEEEPTRSYPYGKASETSGKIKSGAKGDQVRAIQYALNELGYGNSGTNGLDGIFGTGTKKAVKAFQEANGITVDGVVNNKTREKFKMLQFLTGGLVDYTGPAWVDGTKDHPELMLNASDTENMLAAVQTVRSLDTATLMLLDDFIKLATSSMLSVNSLHATGVHNTDQELQQQVHITAEFPNVQDSNEIQDAFDNLINRAAQFVGSIKK